MRPLGTSLLPLPVPATKRSAGSPCTPNPPLGGTHGGAGRGNPTRTKGPQTFHRGFGGGYGGTLFPHRGFGKVQGRFRVPFHSRTPFVPGECFGAFQWDLGSQEGWGSLGVGNWDQALVWGHLGPFFWGGGHTKLRFWVFGENFGPWWEWDQALVLVHFGGEFGGLQAPCSHVWALLWAAKAMK